MPDPLAFRRRHPFCPECGYNLVGTVEAGGRTCPECGIEFTPADLVPEIREGDWTLMRGLRRLAVGLLVRVALVVPATSLVLWPLTPLLDFSIAGGCAGLLIMAALLAPLGAGIGTIIGWRASDLMGCASFLTVVLAVLAALSSVCAAMWLSRAWTTLGGYDGMIAFIIGAAAMLRAGQLTVRDLA